MSEHLVPRRKDGRSVVVARNPLCSRPFTRERKQLGNQLTEAGVRIDASAHDVFSHLIHVHLAHLMSSIAQLARRHHFGEREIVGHFDHVAHARLAATGTSNELK